jgi:hypothetical protein
MKCVGTFNSIPLLRTRQQFKFTPGDGDWHELDEDTNNFIGDSDLFPDDTDLFPEDTDPITSRGGGGGRVSRGFLRECGGQGRGAAGLSTEFDAAEGQGERGRGAAAEGRGPGLLLGGRALGGWGLGGRGLAGRGVVGRGLGGGGLAGRGFGAQDLGGRGLGGQGLVRRGQGLEVRGRGHARGVQELRWLGRGEVQGGDGQGGPARGAGTAPQSRSRHPTGGAPNQNLDLIDPDEYLALNANPNTKKNVAHAVKTYERVMAELAIKSGEHFESLQEAPAAQLPYLLQKFLQTAKTLTGGVFAAGTMNTLFNGICTALMNREEEPVNLKIDPRFKKVQEMLKVRCSVSASEGRGTGCNAKRPVTGAHLAAALQAGTVGRDAPRPLVTAAYLAIVMGMGCRTGAECHMIQNEDLTFGPPSKTGVPQWIELAERITKTRSGNTGDERELTPRIFPDDEFPETCWVRTVLAYQQKKTEAQLQPSLPFFLSVNQHAAHDPGAYHYWYSTRIMGVNTLLYLLTDALELAGIDCKIHKYSAISLRKSMLQSGVDCGVPDMHLSRLAGHKSLVSKKEYIRSAGPAHEASSRVIHQQMYHNVNDGYSKAMRNVMSSSRSGRQGEVWRQGEVQVWRQGEVQVWRQEEGQVWKQVREQEENWLPGQGEL